ncbi:TrbG/VirB9 family P-type conjugative transfer protein [uncultured Brevundimonas sp.]|uniref:TrbG/VirB9 family P-type conjugative transfer protein n=1 Tax=uncultured Brevundimonas sp. TaxID=213418 RepID=UPI0030EB1DF2|tara:strand:- start:11112 stop:11933 length:822 start_codon:yes stop_codon:yes gene_type:complete
MKAFTVPVAVAVLTLAQPAFAQSGAGGRIQEFTYAPDGVYQVSGAFRTATQIIFSPEETIRHAAIGDSVAWEIAAEGSVLFLKPRERHQSTNLLVVTERGGLARHYVFELLAQDRTARTAAYQIRFRYPADEQARAAASLAASAQAAEERLVGLELQAGAVEGRRNLAYSVQGDARLQPSEVTDNGRFTVMRFPGNQPIPAIFEVTSDGSERLVPYDVRGQFVVIHGVVAGLRLRHGGTVLCIFNDAFDARGEATGTGTASPVVDRTVTGDPS